MKISVMREFYPLGGHGIKIKTSEFNIATLIAIIAYIDLLFLPYFQAVIIPYSLPLVLVGIFLMGKVMFPPNTKVAIFCLALLMVVSLVIGFFLPQSAPYAVENIKRLMQFLTSFLYLVFFFAVARHYKIESSLRIISLVFLAYFFVLLAWFFLDPVAVNAMMRQIYGRLVTPADVALIHFRFAYLFKDPNTAGYFLLLAVLPWLILCKNTIFRVAVVFLCVVIAIFIQSRGALLGLILATFLWAFPGRWLMFRFYVRDIYGLLKGLSIIFVVGMVMTVLVFRFFGDMPIFDMSLDRVTDIASYEHGGLRFEIWREYVTELTLLPMGSGHIFNTEYGEFFPHSDFLRLIYSYGFIAAGIFLWLFIRIGWRYPLILMPAFMAFGVNSLIDEQKLFGLFLATLGVFLGIQQRDRASRRPKIIPGDQG